jgi:hypothetical protein
MPETESASYTQSEIANAATMPKVTSMETEKRLSKEMIGWFLENVCSGRGWNRGERGIVWCKVLMQWS